MIGDDALGKDCDHVTLLERINHAYKRIGVDCTGIFTTCFECTRITHTRDGNYSQPLVGPTHCR